MQTGSYLGEDDIVRIEDVYNRKLSARPWTRPAEAAVWSWRARLAMDQCRGARGDVMLRNAARIVLNGSSNRPQGVGRMRDAMTTRLVGTHLDAGIARPLAATPRRGSESGAERRRPRRLVFLPDPGGRAEAAARRADLSAVNKAGF